MTEKEYECTLYLQNAHLEKINKTVWNESKPKHKEYKNHGTAITKIITTLTMIAVMSIASPPLQDNTYIFCGIIK